MTGRLLAAVMVAVFGWAAGTDAFGSEPCPHHDTLADSSGEEAHVPEGGETHGPGHGPEGYAHGHPAPDLGPGHSHSGHESDGPCTCITHCQAPGGDLELSPRVAGPVYQPEVFLDLERPGVHSEVLGPRHHLFELHLPNAPPHST